MTPAALLATVVLPTLVWLGPSYNSPEAQVLLVAIALQESGAELVHRRQLGGGPARGLWEFEADGLGGVLDHPASCDTAQDCLRRLGLAGLSRAALHQHLAEDDRLACAMARLLLWTDPRPLPALGAEMKAWVYYRRNWRPGKPRLGEWAENYRVALEAVTAPALVADNEP